MEIRFMAGEMARLHGISKQTLLYYDKINLLQPREKCRLSGYRYYTLDQFEELELVLYLKNLGISLKEIKDYLDTSSIEERMEKLEGQEQLIQEKMEQLRQTDRHLKAIIESMRANNALIPFEMGVKVLPKRHIVAEPVLPPFDLYSLEVAIKKLINASLPDQKLEINDLLIFVEPKDEVELFKGVAVEVPRPGRAAESMPGGNYAYLYHKGPYGELPASWLQLYAYLDKFGLRAIGPCLEKMLLGAFAVADEQEFLVELQVMVE
ncbi:MerR family transcriptional regulator [Desulfotalea psychrophila]|uniref:Related to transcriptional regulator of multidrug-efflux transporter genes n=1 Tax=Desulfotalea psychrophila (strain LSv54 / DSM 12343) TaxID=177439 RepID=Q6ARV1_DESPS|nr:MerR family transcriptional regulator [Desulfotalea psychrophila]CAG34924.1 related to transcriptional regulator of multidrug-efflux transporter genes [Desulfotalea psychrophila LSv54]